jgi:glycosyltransferase involved in cell wall biosynthesis
MKIVSWQAVFTEHQVHLLRALGKIPGTSLQVHTASEESAERKLQGWVKPEWTDLKVSTFHYWGWLVPGIRVIRDNPDAVHLFSGLWASRRFFFLLLYAVWKKRKVGLLVEPYGDTKDGYLKDQGELKGWLLTKLRPLFYGIAGRLLGKQITPILAISPKAVRQFERAGFQAKNIYPFGYFVPIQEYEKNTETHATDNVLRIIFVGALISRKGINIIEKIALYCYQKSIPITFDIYGPGNPRSLLNVCPNINYRGAIVFGQSQRVMANYDLLIVPSKYEGWGVVVNEALLQGVPVLASSKVGASALIEQSAAGSIFDPNNIPALINIIESLTKDRKILQNWSIKAKIYSKKLSPEVAATYMMGCIESSLNGTDKPTCPWYSMKSYDEYITKISKRKVVFFHRKPQINNFSVEIAFKIMREALPVEVECVVAESKFDSRGVLRRIYNIIEAAFRQGDVNHITGDVHFLSYLLRRDKTLLTILDCVFMYNANGIKRHLLRLLWAIIPEKRVGLITVISESTKNEVLKILHCDPEKIRVIPVCISPNFTRYDKKFNVSKPSILQIGTAKNKNLIRLVSALQGITCKLDIIGKLSNEQILALQENKIDYVNSFNLTEDEVIHKYKESDFITFVSTYEGFGMPIIEANTIGRPVIIGNVLSMPEVAGNAACMVDPYNISDIRAGLLRIINDESYRETLIKNGFINARRFNPRVIANQYLKIYQEISTR